MLLRVHTNLPSHVSDSFPLFPVLSPVLTVSEEVLSLVLGSRLGLGGGCFLEVGLPSSSPPPTECRDCERTVKPGPQGGGTRSWGAGIVMKPIRKCLPAYPPPSVTRATSSPILKRELTWSFHTRITLTPHHKLIVLPESCTDFPVLQQSKKIKCFNLLNNDRTPAQINILLQINVLY